MSQFFADMRSFRKDLRTRRDAGGRCWSCSSPGGLLVGLDIHRDFRTLGFPTRGCQRSVTLCPRCTVAYMNSFNASLDRRQGKEVGPGEWTVEKFLAFAGATRPHPTAGSPG